MRALKLILKTAAIGLFVGVVAFAAFFIWIMRGTETEPEISDADKLRSNARLICRDEIARRLKDPDSADWGMKSGTWYATWPASINGSDISVAPEFRASNSFGARIISKWDCSLKADGQDLRLVNLREI